MINRVHVICEGSTEALFVKRLIGDHLGHNGIFVYPSLIGIKGHKGGNVTINRLITDIRARLLDDKTSYCTVFFDYYGLAPDFPGKESDTGKTSSRNKSECLLQAFGDAVRRTLGEDAGKRFIPYVQMHEFEGLLFSDPAVLARSLNKPDWESRFTAIRKKHQSPEEINDNPNTAPSKRIRKIFPGYDKPAYGVAAAVEIGLDRIRKECPLFNAWITRLEQLGSV